jgi:hypothetical protein
MSAPADQNMNLPAGNASTPVAVQAGHEVTTPIIVSLGKKKKKAIKRLKRGKGPAMDEVMDVVEQVQANLGDQAGGKVIVPIVVLFKQKQRRFRSPF